MSSNVPGAAVSLSGFSLIRHDRSDGRRGGGVIAYVSDGLATAQLKEFERSEFQTFWLLLKQQLLPRGLNSIILGIINHPPGYDDKDLLEHLTKSLDNSLARQSGAGIILTGGGGGGAAWRMQGEDPKVAMCKILGEPAG